MKTSAILIERIVRFTIPKYTIRVWMHENLEFQHTPLGITEIEIIAHKNQDLPMRELVEKILEVDGVSAVECLDWMLNGMIAYANRRGVTV